mmetsp:Transcript_16127/g.34903  ORF Transcript_16127/g.34903 Transcript_16127/m.34903 type:complete len:271 (+) Transcript_16127:1-813(+)
MSLLKSRTVTRLLAAQSKPQVRCRDSYQAGPSQEEEDNNTLTAIGMAALWIGLLAYVFMLAPNQTPYRDQLLIKLIVGITKDDTYQVNQVFYCLFNIMGIYPAIYASLLIPAGRSENKVPAWPFVTLSFAFGVFALLPYFVLWRPAKDLELPPPKQELEGWNKLFLRGAETPVMPAVLLAASVYLIGTALTAGSDAWLGYLKLFDESRLVHVTTLDFATLTALAPFWMSNDAQLRDWKDREKLLPILSVLPVVGPAVYLLLRPKSGEQSS